MVMASLIFLYDIKIFFTKNCCDTIDNHTSSLGHLEDSSSLGHLEDCLKYPLLVYVPFAQSLLTRIL